MALRVASKGEHGGRRFGRDDRNADGTRCDAGPHLERIEIMADLGDVGERVGFRHHDGVEARPDDSGQIRKCQSGIERIDAHHEPPRA